MHLTSLAPCLIATSLFSINNKSPLSRAGVFRFWTPYADADARRPPASRRDAARKLQLSDDAHLLKCWLALSSHLVAKTDREIIGMMKLIFSVVPRTRNCCGVEPISSKNNFHLKFNKYTGQVTSHRLKRRTDSSEN